MTTIEDLKALADDLLCAAAVDEVDSARQKFDEAIEQYAAERVSAQWKPIDTAPRDGSRVLIHTPEASRLTVQEAYWAKPWEGARDEQCYWSTPNGPAGRGYTILPVAVTHWMPLPDAPIGEQQNG